MLDIASPTATSSQDVSRSGDHADTATTTPESTVSTNVGGPVNQTPSPSASSAPSNLYQLNPVSDSVADGTSGDLSSTKSSSGPLSLNAVSDPAMTDNNLEPSPLNAAQLNQLNPSATSTSSRLSQAAGGAQLASSVPQTLNPVSAFDDVFQNGVLSGNGDLTMSQPSVQAVSSNLNIPHNGAIPLHSSLESIGTKFAGVSSQGSNLNIPQSAIPLHGGLNAIKSIGTNFAGVSSQESNLNILQNDAIPLHGGLNSIIGTNFAAVSSQESNPNIPQNGAIPLHSGLGTIKSIGTNFAGVSSQGSNLNIPQSGAISLHSGLDAIGSDIIGISRVPVSSLTSSFHPVQAASNAVSDLSRQPSFTNDFTPDSLNTPRISNGVETSPDHIEADTVATTTGNCICNS